MTTPLPELTEAQFFELPGTEARQVDVPATVRDYLLQIAEGLFAADGDVGELVAL